MGWPIQGDPIYGAGARDAGSALQLHARHIVIPMQPKKPPIEVTAPVPAHMLDRLARCGFDVAHDTAHWLPLQPAA